MIEDLKAIPQRGRRGPGKKGASAHAVRDLEAITLGAEGGLVRGTLLLRTRL